MTRIKICGITNEADARFALLSGAHFLGFIFHPPSPRATTAEEVRAIVQRLRNDAETGPMFSAASPPRLVGVFVNKQSLEIAAVLDYCGLDMAQLSGDETPEWLGETSPLNGRVYKVLQPQSMDEARSRARDYAPSTPQDAPSLLIDAFHPALRGGTGETADWQIASELTHLTPRLMLAGGLNPSNVAEAVRRVRPFAVDVASGVEARPGIKDPHKVEQFIRAVKQAPA